MIKTALAINHKELPKLHGVLSTVAQARLIVIGTIRMCASKAPVQLCGRLQ